MENEMMDAVRNGDTKNLELLLEQGTDPNFEDRWGTALGNASVKGRRDIYELLLYWGADPNLKDQFGSTALSGAAQSGHTDIIRLLLDWGVDPNIRNKHGSTALMYASRSGNIDIIRLLLDRGANPNIRTDGGSTALMWASIWDNTAIVRLLLDNGANPNFVDEHGETALTRATDNGNTAIVTLLMRYMTTIRMQSLQRGKMTRRKLRTSMARKRSSTSQLGDRYALGEDIIHRLNSHMTRPNLTDMIDEIPRNMTRTNRRDSYEIEDDFFNNSDSDSDDYGKAFKHGSEPEPEQVFEPEPEPEPEPEQVFEPVTDREIIDDVNHEYNKGLEIDLKRHRLENELKEKKQRESDSRHEMARSQRRERLRSVLESAKEPLNNHDMEEIRRRRLARFSKLTGAGRNRRNKTRNKYMY